MFMLVSKKGEVLINIEDSLTGEWVSTLVNELVESTDTKETLTNKCKDDFQFMDEYNAWNYFKDLDDESKKLFEEVVGEYIDKIIKQN